MYVIYIATTPDKLWEALTTREFTRRYWFGVWPESQWTVGSTWQLMGPDGRVCDSGEVLEIDRPRRLAVSWRHELDEDLRQIGFTRATFALEPAGDVVKLTVTHEAPEGGEPFINAVSTGWPHILSSLKSLLETGKALPATDTLSSD
jgi:uncharacterized protein YndB with AHSA1/START domain